MKLATLRDGTRDGRLLVVDPKGERCAPAEGIARTLQEALDHWEEKAPALEALYRELKEDPSKGVPLDLDKLHAPLPRAYEWIDGSAYINHIVLVRKARNAEPPETLETDPLVYQGGSGVFLGPRQDIPLPDPALGPRLRGGDLRRPRRHPAGGEQGGGRRLRAAVDAGQRHHLPEPHPRRAEEELRLLQLQAGDGLLRRSPSRPMSWAMPTRDGRVHLRLLLDPQRGRWPAIRRRGRRCTSRSLI